MGFFHDMIIVPDLTCMDEGQQPKEPTTQPPQGLTGGVTIADFPPLSTPEPQEPTPETVVVPPGDVGQPPGQATVPPPSGENPFIPNVIVPQAPPPAVAGGGSLARRILTLVVGISALVLLILGGRFGWRMVSGPQEVTLTYWGLWENDAIVGSLIADFEAKNPKIKVQYIKQSPKQYRERLQSAINRGEGPDIFRFHNTWVPMLQAQLAPVPKTVMTTDDFSNTFYSAAVSDLVAGSKIYGLPLMVDGLGLYYNEDLLANVGATPPSTWAELLSLVPRLTVKNGQTIVTAAIALGTANNVEHMSDILAVMFMQNGANLIELSGKEAEETLIFYRKFADTSDPLYTWNETMDNSIYAFATGRVAMILAPSWRAFDIKQINSQLRFKIASIPQLPGNTVTWGSYWVEGVSAKSKYQEQAWTFVKYLTSREGASRLYTEAAKTRLFGEPYARIDLGQTVESDPFVGAYVAQAETAKSFPLASRTFDNGLNDKMIKYLEDAVNGLTAGSSPSRVLETLRSGFRQVLTTYGLVSTYPPATQ